MLKLRLILLLCLCAQTLNAQVAISSEVITDIIKSIPAPLEISFLIKDLDIRYDKTLLNKPENAKKYTTEARKALNLGVYSTNLGYANIYQKNQDAWIYLESIKVLAEGLQISEQIDYPTIKKIVSTGGDFDELLTITVSNLENINKHLFEKKRPDLTILILTGGWLESLHLTVEIAKKYPNEILKTRLGEQTLILEQLLLLLSFYEQENNVLKELITDLNKLGKVYENVKVIYSNVNNTRTSEIVVTDKDLNAILENVRAIRKKMIEGV